MKLITIQETEPLNVGDLESILTELTKPGAAITPEFLAEHLPLSADEILAADKKDRRQLVIHQLMLRAAIKSEAEIITPSLTPRPLPISEDRASLDITLLINDVIAGKVEVNDALLTAELPLYRELVLQSPVANRKKLAVHYLEVKRNGGTTSTFEAEK